MYIIYCHTNKKTGKKYIGFTSKSVDERWKQHVTTAQNLKSMTQLSIAIRSSLEDDWVHDVIDHSDSENDAKKRESFWIAEFKTNCLEEGHVGYNMTNGGDGLSLKGESNPMFGRKGCLCPNFGLRRSDETRMKMSESAKIRASTQEFKEKASRIHKGKIVSIETRNLISASKRGKGTGKDNPAYGKVYRTKQTHPEWVEKIRDSLRGEKNPFFGKKHSEKSKEKIKTHWALRRFRKAAWRWFNGL